MSPPDDSDFEDSLLKAVAHVTLPVRRPRPGEHVGGADGRRFEILGELGGGAMGQVFRARDAELQRIVALKFLQPLEEPADTQPVERLRQEARAIAQLDHENIVRVFDVSEWTPGPWEGRVPFLVMECLEGESLRVLMRREGRLGVRRALGIVGAVAAGLAHAHERHLIHRDLKPGNVFLTRAGTVKLLDFGLAWLAAQGVPSIPQLPTAGTPRYMAPEQWRGEPQDERTDLWAVGVLLYELLMDEPPFQAGKLEELRARVLSGAPVPSVRERRPELPQALDGLLASLLAREPERRLGSAAELLERLRQVEEALAPWRGEPDSAAPGRRQVTLVGCWLAGLAGLAGRLDAEDFEEVQAAFHQVCSRVVGEHGGSIALCVGDEVLACFGYPRAQEEDSDCAARTGLALPQAIREALRERLPPSAPPLAVKVGVHTDTVVFDDLPAELRGRTPSLQGEAPQVALWLARQAEPDAVVLSGTSASLLQRAFLSRPLGPRVFEGLSGRREVEVFRLLRERRGVSRFGREHAAEALTPLVDRREELVWLLEGWARACAGQGTFMLLSGEAGIGKSRLIQELWHRVPAASAPRLRGQCWSQSSHSAFQPFIEMLQRSLRLPPGQSPEERLARLRQQLGVLGLGAEQVGLVASFLSLPGDEGPLQLHLSPQRKKEKTFEALLELLRRSARRGPVLAVLEDLHWADPSTLELLGHVLEHLGAERICVVLSARPGLQPAWPRSEALRTRGLERLPAREAAALVREVAGGRALPEGTVDALVERTDGVPLFVEELTRRVLEPSPARNGARRRDAIPLTLNELLLTRLDQLPPRPRALAQLCAVVGRNVPEALLATLIGGPRQVLGRELARLCEAGVLRPEETATDGAGYQFRHALLQEAAYQSLLRGTRRRYHARVAQALEARFPEVASTRPEVLAHHFTEAGLVEPAVRHWARAGELASRRSANVEAVSHLGQALTLLRSLPDAAARQEEELQLLLALGMPLMQVEGCSPRVELTYTRAWELMFALGEALPRLRLSYWGIFSYYFARARFHQAHRLAEHLVKLGERQGDDELLALGLRMLAVDVFTFGDIAGARRHVERALACSDFGLERHRALAVKQWIDPRAAALAYGAVVYSVLDRPEKAVRLGLEAVRLAEEIGHPHTTAFVLTYTSLACQLRREPQRAREGAERCIALCREHRFLIWLGWSTLIRAWALAEQGQPREGLALMQAALAQWRGAGLRAGMPLFSGMVAEVQLKLGRPTEALASVAEGLGWADTTGERSYEVELCRLEGECLRALGREVEATQRFLEALKVARKQGARAFARRVEERLAEQLRAPAGTEETQHML